MLITTHYNVDGRPRNDPVNTKNQNKPNKSFQWLQTSIQVTRLQEQQQKLQKQLNSNKNKNKNVSSLHTPDPPTTISMTPQVQRLHSTLQRNAKLREQKKHANSKLSELKQLPGETYYKFVQRVRQSRNDTLQSDTINKSTNKNTNELKHDTMDNTELQTKYIKKQHSKLLNKRLHQQSIVNDQSLDSVQSTYQSKKQKHYQRQHSNDHMDKVKFGEVVDRPPNITVKPKLPPSSSKLSPNNKSSTATDNDVAAIRNQQRVILNARQIENERVKAIEIYKAMKLKQQQAK